MLAHYRSAEPGAMYVIINNVSVATLTDWHKNLTDIGIKDALTAEAPGALLWASINNHHELILIICGAHFYLSDMPSGSLACRKFCTSVIETTA